MKARLLTISIALLLGADLRAQESSAQSDAAQASADDMAAAEAPPSLRPAPRKIESREFSNRDKLLLLLSTHCDFPTKEELIYAVNTSMLIKDREQEKTGTGGDEEALPAQPRSAKQAVVAQAEIEDYLQQLLYSILGDMKQLLTVRLRALEALTYFNTPQNVEMLRNIVSRPERIEQPLMLVQAIRSYPQVAPDEAPAALAQYLDSPNDMIRFVTISTLKNTPGDEAVRVLEERRRVETNQFFQNRLDDAISNHCRKETFCGTSMRF